VVINDWQIAYQALQASSAAYFTATQQRERQSAEVHSFYNHSCH